MYVLIILGATPPNLKEPEMQGSIQKQLPVKAIVPDTKDGKTDKNLHVHVHHIQKQLPVKAIVPDIKDGKTDDNLYAYHNICTSNVFCFNEHKKFLTLL